MFTINLLKKCMKKMRHLSLFTCFNARMKLLESSSNNLMLEEAENDFKALDATMDGNYENFENIMAMNEEEEEEEDLIIDRDILLLKKEENKKAEEVKEKKNRRRSIKRKRSE